MREQRHISDDEDYTLMERDFDEFIRRGKEELEWEAKHREG